MTNTGVLPAEPLGPEGSLLTIMQGQLITIAAKLIVPVNNKVGIFKAGHLPWQVLAVCKNRQISSCGERVNRHGRRLVTSWSCQPPV